MAYDKTPGRGSLYRFDPDRSVSVILRGVTVSNGLGWSPDGTRAYYIDTPTQRVDVFDISVDGSLSGRRTWVEVPLEHGRPDGLTVDNEGGVWVAMFGGAAVRRYTAEGAHDTVISAPVPDVTACAFGGADMDELFITTSRLRVPSAAVQGAGALFKVRCEVSGLPVAAFAG